MKETLNFLFSFKGQLSRIEYAGISAGIVVLSIAIEVIANILAPSISSAIFALLMFILLIACLWVSIASAVKRLHNLGRSGWWCLLFIVPLVNLIFFLYLLLKRGEAHHMAKTMDFDSSL